MHTWQDDNGNSHGLQVTYPVAKRLRTEVDGLDLMAAYKDPSLLESVFDWFTDDENLVQFCLVVEDRQDAEQFAELFIHAGILQDARAAAVRAVIDFFPPVIRKALTEVHATLCLKKTIQSLTTACSTPDSGSTIRGSGANESSAASDAPTPPNSHCGRFSHDTKADEVTTSG